ncbi:hypothetical protein BsWGS_23840 [Bradybaena similaris]
MVSLESVVVIALMSSLLVVASDDVCPYQECSCQGSYIECQSRHLNSVPKLVTTTNTAFKVLMLDSNRITRIVSGSLPPHLSEISVTLNAISTIDDEAFNQSATTLETLRFDGAHFTRIPDAFLRLHNLKKLYIYNTAISDWNPAAMRNIGHTLETLFLGNVGLASWPDWMQDFSRLFNLYISDSSFTSLPDNALTVSASSLTILSMIGGRLTAVPKTIANHTALKSIFLQNNQIIDITWLPHLSNLSSLCLNYNNISDAGKLSSVLRPFAHSLTSLHIFGNQLTVIPDLSYLTHIGGLDLGHNRISDPDSGAVASNLFVLSMAYNSLPSIPRVLAELTAVTEVYLPSNVITQIKGTDFPLMTVIVRLQNNLISELADDSFPVNSSIRFLLLSNNPIATVSAHAFSNLPRLRELDLQQSKLTRLPPSLASLDHIFTVDISNSTDLVCTCEEKSLQTWISSLSSYNVIGNCGDTSVYNFFTTLSLTCSTS